MPSQAILNQQVVKHHWQLPACDDPQLQRLAEQSGLEQVSLDPSQLEHLILTPDQWQNCITQHQQPAQLVVPGETEVEAIVELIGSSGIYPKTLFIDFPVFTDGRGYSLARLLQRLEWVQNLGAIGDILQDQFFFYWRCGFNIILPRHDQNIQQCINALTTFTQVYQPATRGTPESLIKVSLS